MSDIKMHFVIPASLAPAKHMVSGEPSGVIPLAQALRQQIGHQGKSYRLACNPNLATNERHRASGEPWALLEVINGQVAIGDSACQACIKSKEWQEAYQKFKDENDGRPHPNLPVPEEVVAKSSGGCC